MNLDFSKLFPVKKEAVKIRVLRGGMQVRTADGEMIVVATGDEVTIDRDELQKYDADDCVILAEPAKGITDPSPARPTSAPLPDRWKSLPKCFADYHELSEDFRTARAHVALISNKRIDIFGGNLGRIGEATGKIFMGRILKAATRFDGDIHTQITEIDMDDPETRQIDRFLHKAETSAIDYLERLKQTKSIALQRLFLACGDERLKSAEELRVVLDEVADLGFSIFKQRVAALGLHQDHVRRLFRGSSDAVKYANHGQPGYCDCRSAGLDESGQMIAYIDEPVTSTAQNLTNDRERLEMLRPLLVEARKELARAQKVAA